MNEADIEQFQLEQLEGGKAQHAYDQYIRDFIDHKRQVLFLNFQNLPLTAEDDIMEVKRMLYAIDTLEQDIMTVIETGRLASISLTKLEEEVKH